MWPMLQEKYTDTFESIIYLIGVLVTNIPLRPNFSKPQKIYLKSCEGIYVTRTLIKYILLPKVSPYHPYKIYNTVYPNGMYTYSYVQKTFSTFGGIISQSCVMLRKFIFSESLYFRCKYFRKPTVAIRKSQHILSLILTFTIV